MNETRESRSTTKKDIVKEEEKKNAFYPND